MNNNELKENLQALIHLQDLNVWTAISNLFDVVLFVALVLNPVDVELLKTQKRWY